jgi:hexosaminidase
MLNLVPYPQICREKRGEFLLTRRTRIAGAGAAAAMGEYLAGRLRPATGFPLKVQKSGSGEGVIRLATTGPDCELGDEGYRLCVAPNGVDLSAPGEAGLLYGIQTFLQLLPDAIESQWRVPKMDPLPPDCVLPEGWKPQRWFAPCVEIEDRPSFAWRGFMLDCSRHFRSLETLKWCVEKMVRLKMNRFHLHLTDNHGWRIEVPGWPKLAEVGGFVEPEPRREGFYTADDIREIVRYAAERNIMVVPEIDLPGHCYSAVASYPELCCTGRPRRNDMSHFHQLDILCAGNEGVYGFVRDVLAEVLRLFPAPYVHIGGDEAPKNRWRVCPKCQARIRTEGLKDESELQAYFIGRVAEMVRREGKRIIAWDDVLAGHPEPDVIVHWWSSARGVIAPLEAARRGHQVICSRSDWSYFGAWSWQLEPFYTRAEYLPREFTGFREERPAGHPDPEEWRSILGAECCMWGESTPDELLSSRIFPAILANAELQWHYLQPRQRDYPGFHRRVRALQDYFDGTARLNWGS